MGRKYSGSSINRRARCDASSGAWRMVVWQRWDAATVTPLGALVSRLRGKSWFTNSRPAATPTAKSPDAPVSAKQPFENSCAVWVVKTPLPKPNCSWPPRTTRTQTCRLLLHRSLRRRQPSPRRTRTQSCPLFLHPQLPRPAWTSILPIVAPTDCWPGWVRWKTPPRCSVLAARFRGPGFCWPCPLLSPAASSSAPT